MLEWIGPITDQGDLKIPLLMCLLPAGYPSQGEDDIEDWIDLNSWLVEHPGQTQLLQVKGDSMIGAGIASGDYLVVDQAAEPTHGDLVIAEVQGELTLKRLRYIDKRICLVPENPDYPIIVSQGDIKIWGVVLTSFRRHNEKKWSYYKK